MYPILVIITNKECGHCQKMRGKDGWPSDKLAKRTISTNSSWNNDFFKKSLTAGSTNYITQKSRIIEVHYDKLKHNPRIIEVTFFDLNDILELQIKKYRPSLDNRTVMYTKDNLGFIVHKNLKYNFDEFISRYIPVKLLQNYLHIYPSWMYVHSTIWEKSIHQNSPLYLRVQGYKTVRDGENPDIFKILKEKTSNIEEKDRDPVDIIKRLIDYDLVPLYYPSDYN